MTLIYAQNDVLQTVGPQPTGENAKRKQLEFDALGRLTSVCEITSAVGAGSCVQSTAATGYWTKYTYDVLNNLTGVTQNAQSGNAQSRAYTYDGLGRMASETTPEGGTVSYSYDILPSPCGGAPSSYPGDLTKRVDAGGGVNCYYHDALHRLTDVGFSGPTCRRFRYDSATVNGVVMVNTKGHLAEAYTDACGGSKITDVGFSYTARGETSDVYESTPHSGGYYHVTESFWANGVVHQLSGLPGLPTLTYGVDGEGRLYSVSASTGQNPLTSTTYSAASLPTQVNLGSTDSDSYTFDPNSNRMTQYKFNVNGQSVVGTLTWNSIGTLASLSVTDPFFAGGNQSCSYTHDDMTRIASAICGTAWSQTFSYDAFGNISKTGTISFQPTYSYQTNRMTQIGGSSPTYDPNGNVTNDFLHTYTYDNFYRPVTIDTVGITYDALGRMIEQNHSGVFTEIVYGPSGGKLALMSGQTLQRAFVPLTGGAIAVYNSAGLAFYRHSDWLGSSRFASTSTRAMYSDSAYAPFGEAYAQSGTTDLSFTGMNQDTVSNLFDFVAREYGTQGRWPSPDPLGLRAATLSDPQSLNRYAYVGNSPLDEIDPLGLKTIIHGRFGDDGGIIGLLGIAISMGFGSGPGAGTGTCSVDGVDTSCGTVARLLQNGGAAVCPDNDCSKIRTGENGQWQVFVQSADQNPPCDPGAICVGTGGTWVDANRAPTPAFWSMAGFINFGRAAAQFATRNIPGAGNPFKVGGPNTKIPDFQEPPSLDDLRPEGKEMQELFDKFFEVVTGAVVDGLEPMLLLPTVDIKVCPGPCPSDLMGPG